MPINLQKGQKVDLTKTNPGLTKMCIGLGWDINKYDGGNAFDLDTAAFLLGENGKVRKQNDFVFYSNLNHESGAVVHKGDNRTGGSRKVMVWAGYQNKGMVFLNTKLQSTAQFNPVKIRVMGIGVESALIEPPQFPI